MPAQYQLPRRTLEELVAIHNVEPDIHDVIVEGQTDQNIIEWFLLENGRTKCAVYEVALFEIDPAKVLALGLQDNNRGRVIAVAETVAARCPGNAFVTCVADRDFNTVLPRRQINKPNSPFLVFTDYACMLMYAFDSRILGKYIRFRLKKFKKPARQVIQELSEALQVLFAVRLAMHVLALGLENVEWRDCCSMEELGVVFDVERYLVRYLNKNARRNEGGRVAGQIQQCRRWMNFDPRLQIRGHDFIAMFIWYVSQHRGFGAFARQTEEAIESELFFCIELRDLAGERLFQTLLKRIDE